jgi:predicted alpha/beta-fold hydrolase
MTPFKPPFLLRNSHLQTILASIGPRKSRVHKKAKQLINSSKLYTLDCGDGVRLQGLYSPHPQQRGLVIMIHGWLGNNNSLYLLSTASELYQQGYSVFRLNLRDHGDSSQLNKQLFHSARLTEVINAIKQVQQLFPQSNNYLLGFSLGGNFSLRIAAHATNNNIQLSRVVAICPVINPSKTNRNLHAGPFIYHHYFRNKWKHSLRQKLQFFPEHDYRQTLGKLKTLDEMNQYFVPNHTEFNSVEDYLQGYAIGGDYLAEVDIPCHIISSADDPVIFAEDLQELPNNKNLSIELTEYGGHCGYLENYRFGSWIDKRVADLLSSG